MYMAQPGHIDHIKQINAGRVYVDRSTRSYFAHRAFGKVSLHRQASRKLRASY